jgi:Secretion system C-terminal sorting domain
MKKTLLLIVLACFGANAIAQITILQGDMPVAGDTFRYNTVQAIGAGINVNNTGANFTWNFTNLTANGEDLLDYKRSAQTPYAFYFINTFGTLVLDNLGFGQFSLNEIYNFYRTTATTFTAEGIGFKFNNIPLGGFYTDKDEIYSFPLQYTDKDSSNFRVAVQIPTLGNYRQSGKRVNTVDGWGTVNLPNNKSYNCIRVKSVLTQVDSISVSQPFPLSFGIPTTRTEYKWLTKNEKVPVLEVSGNNIAGNFVASSVRFLKKTGSTGPGIGVQEKQENKIAIYPNPAADKLLVSLPNYGETHVKMFTIEGKEVTVSFERENDELKINTCQLPSGFYMLFAKSGNQMLWEKVEIYK